MDDRILKRLENKVDMTNEHLASIDITLAKQSIILEEHTKRSTALEAQVEPLKNHVERVNGALKFIKVLGILAALAEAIRMLK